MKIFLNLLLEYWPILAPLIYEGLARIWPTKWNISILDNLWKLLNAILPNNRIPDGTEKIESNASGQLVNKIKVKIGRHVLRALLLCILASGFANAQIWQNFKGVRLVNQLDSNTVLPVNGTIWYNEEKLFPRFQVWENDTLKDLLRPPQLISGGGVNTIGAINGVSKSANGASILDSTIYFQTGDATFPGLNFPTTASNGLTKTGENITLGDISMTNDVDFLGNVRFQFGTVANPLGSTFRIASSQVFINSFTAGGDINLNSIDDLFLGTSNDVSLQVGNDLLISLPSGDLNINSGDLQYFGPTNQILLVNTALTHSTSIFGGEIQLDRISPAEDLTINNASITVTGTPFEIAVNNSDLTLSSASSDIIINPGSDVILTPGGFVNITPLTDNTATDILAVTSGGNIVKRTNLVGSYDATFFGGTNLINATTSVDETFLNAGTYVTVNIMISTLTLTAGTTLTTFDVSLPIPSNFSTAAQAFGQIHTTDGAIGTVVSDATDDRVLVTFTSVGTSTSAMIIFTYEVI